MHLSRVKISNTSRDMAIDITFLTFIVGLWKTGLSLRFQVAG